MPDTCTNYSGNCANTAKTWTHWTTEWQCTANSTINIWVAWTDAGTSTPAGWNRCYTGGISDNAAHKEYEQKREVARERAKEILQRNLTEEQQAQLTRERFFIVRGSAGKAYRVNQGRAGNVEMLTDQGEAMERLCCHPEINCPDEDTMLAQKLALETDEETFRKTANVTRLVA